MDVESTFFNGRLQEDIFMQQVIYVQAGNEQLLCNIKKLLYRLKQSMRCWNVVLNDYLKSIKFQQSGADPCLYISKYTDCITIIAVHVDDLIVIASTA